MRVKAIGSWNEELEDEENGDQEWRRAINSVLATFWDVFAAKVMA